MNTIYGHTTLHALELVGKERAREISRFSLKVRKKDQERKTEGVQDKNPVVQNRSETMTGCEGSSDHEQTSEKIANRNPVPTVAPRCMLITGGLGEGPAFSSCGHLALS